MTVKLNESALAALLDTREGPIGQLVEQRARLITEEAKTNARIIMHRNPVAAEAVDYALDAEMGIVIGVRDEGSMARYLANKAAGLVTTKSAELFEEGWLTAALRGFGD